MGVLRHLVSWPISWLCYGIGHLCSALMNLWDNEYWAGVLYPMYNNLMIGSSNIQDWAGGQEPRYPWGKYESSGPA